MKMFLISTMCFVYIRVCRENSETKDGAPAVSEASPYSPGPAPKGAWSRPQGGCINKKLSNCHFAEKMFLSLRLGFLKLFLLDVWTKKKMFLDSCMCFFIEGVCRENSETKDGAEPRADRREANSQKVLNHWFWEKCVFSTIVFFETGLCIWLVKTTA